VNIILTFFFAILVGGCAVRPPQVTSNEPDSEWILEQYHNQDEVTVNARRIREGW
jgi:starvation-inducible outer membrane lipoprotein